MKHWYRPPEYVGTKNPWFVNYHYQTVPTVHTTRPLHLINLEHIALIISGEGHKSRSSPLHNILQPPVSYIQIFSPQYFIIYGPKRGDTDWMTRILL
jgi:hypothetical protein